ncbi:amino acid ABC transporter substrate-binding protein (PAAT family) [Tamaricihabitans halophyticus]|uniref:Amino acid ABC transporter substrate-binding protein (PAAT family) n=1 Tax=Tamaricihabitans halophyticus TaxID=1262583 RepID=A0A4R2QEB1_9PSEU|nr:transporter substrate-binding domain-containing protein [Tamaricihabitans halophyticus]TCP47327.1 amino acid ABC transporter substrate-binding protein (PAAT family) [Tamaricihabitans halophyticus]
MNYSRRKFFVTSSTAAAAFVLAGCRGINPERLGGQADGFANVDQSGVVAQGPIGKNLPSSPILDEVRGRGFLRCSGTDTLPGFSQTNPVTGKLAGFDAGMAELFAKYLLGKPAVNFVKSGADTREAFLQNRTVDATISTYTITENRERIVNFAGPYLTVTSGVAVQLGETGIASSADLAGREVAVQPGAAEEALLREVPNAVPVRFEESSQCFAALQQQRVEAWVANTAIITSRAGTDSRTTVTDIRFGESPFGIGLPKGDDTYKTVATEFINTIAEDGTWQKLWDETAGLVDRTTNPEPPAIPMGR